MARHGDRHTEVPPPPHAQDPLWYWWHVLRGPEVMQAFRSAPESEAWNIVHRYPVLLLPELVEAAERALGKARAFDGLRQMQQALRGTPLFVPYHRLLARVLAGERTGSRRVNLERAQLVMKDVRAVEVNLNDPEDERIEEMIKATLASLTPAPEVKPAAHAMFMDETDLPVHRRHDDRRDVNPSARDRAFTAQAGLAGGSVEWLGPEASPVYRFVDARWMFSSSKTAKAYIDTPSTLQLAADGLPNPAMPTIGDGAYSWGGAFMVGDPPARTSRQVLLFRIDRVVARFDVTEGVKAPLAFQVLSQALLKPYAEAVIRRVRFALAQYWLGVCRGTAAAQRFIQATPRVGQTLFAEYPILLLPEFPTAITALGEQHRPVAERLQTAQASLKSNWAKYREVMRALVQQLLEETGGESKVNADAAHRLVLAHRRLDSDYAWAALEAESSSRTS